MKKVAMIGVGKLGQDCAEVMADAGYDVVGYDIEPRTPAFPMRGTIQEAVHDRDIIFIAAPTPHDPIYGGETPTSHLPNKDFDYTIVKNILTEVNRHVNKSQLVVLISTVLPGTVRSILEPCITNARFIYNPYLIAMGTIKWDMVNPEMVIIGTEDGSLTGDASELIDFYKVFMQNDPRYEVGTWDEAESIKIFYNTFISTKLALVNMIQDVAETNGNINVDVVTNALKKSTYRIMGPAYMTAAFGDAGACHPRDNIALRYLADRLDLGYDLFDAIMKAREVQAERMALRCLKNGRNITIVGKAYKPSVPYTNGSASMLVGYYIEKHGGNLNYYDPNTGDHDLREDWTQVYLIGYWEPYVENLQFKDPGAVVIDPWRRITSKQHTGEIIYYGDSRTKHRYEVPDSTISTMRNQLFEMFTDLAPHSEDIHLVDATINVDTTFVLRPTEDIVKELLAAKESGKSKFLFFACTEAFMPHVLSKIQRLASILDGVIDERDFIFLTTVPDAEKIYHDLREKNVWNKLITIWACNFFNYITTTYARGFEYIGSYDVRFRSKIFTCFNKLNREHRMALVDRMLASNLVVQSYYSFEGDTGFVDYIPSISEEKYPFLVSNKDLFPIRLNITEERSNPVNIETDDLIYYKDSYFSVVTETLFYSKNLLGQHHRPFVEDSMFLTEKTYRCFAMLHPFILMARPHSLKELRRQGYKTFSPFINESYDSIEDDHLRFEAIVKEIQRLSNLTGADWQVWQQNIRDIVHYNHEHFHNNRNFVFTDNYMEMFLSDNRTKPLVSTPVLTPPTPPVQKLELPVEPLNFRMVDFPMVNESIPEVSETSVEIDHESLEPFNIADSSVDNESMDNDSVTLDSIDYVSKLRKSITNASSLDWRNKTVKINNLKVSFPNHVDGGGYELIDEVISLIERTGKDKYAYALDWCSGYGPWGFSILTSNKADKVMFNDIYSVAIETVTNNADALGLSNRIKTIVGSTMSDLPNTEKFDLVVANPPHSSSDVHVTDLNTKRIIVDIDFAAQKDFYTNIRKYLTDDADIYISAGSGDDDSPFVIWAMEGGLQFMGFCPSVVLHSGGYYHFKVQN
jgi:UDPglucose 6-dehydrogenase